MAGFPLLSLCPDLFAQVINKLPEKTYFRLQQTCSAVNEVIQRCRDISVHVDGRYCIEFDVSRQSFQLHFHPQTIRSFDVETPFGCRLELLTIPEGAEELFREFCEYLRQHRITSRKVQMHRAHLTKEQSVTLFRILKPVAVLMNSVRSNRLEALLQPKTVRRVEVAVKQDEVAVAATKLISAIPEIELTVWPIGKEPLSLLQTFLPILQDQKHSNLGEFNFFARGSWDTPSTDEVEKIIRDFKLVAKIEHKVYAVDVRLDGSQCFLRGSSCHVYISNQLFQITYCR